MALHNHHHGFLGLCAYILFQVTNAADNTSLAPTCIDNSYTREKGQLRRQHSHECHASKHICARAACPAGLHVSLNIMM
eukprot:6216964-Amphidinium_carterae.2